MSTIGRTEILWQDRKHWCGFPQCFMRYAVTADRVMFKEGFLNERHVQVLLHRIKDVSAERSFSQRLFGVGTVTLTTYDDEVYKLENINEPMGVKEFLHTKIEEQKYLRRYRYRGYDTFNEWRRGDLPGKGIWNEGFLY